MSVITLNIGLWINGQIPADPLAHQQKAILNAVQLLQAYSVRTQTLTAKSGEPTLVARIVTTLDIISIECAVMALCYILNQDCIALSIDGTGLLIGPVTEPYGGAFNPSYFIEAD